MQSHVLEAILDPQDPSLEPLLHVKDDKMVRSLPPYSKETNRSTTVTPLPAAALGNAENKKR
jgi:hypothetical protein